MLTEPNENKNRTSMVQGPRVHCIVQYSRFDTVSTGKGAGKFDSWFPQPRYVAQKGMGKCSHEREHTVPLTFENTQKGRRILWGTLKTDYTISQTSTRRTWKLNSSSGHHVLGPLVHQERTSNQNPNKPSPWDKKKKKNKLKAVRGFPVQNKMKENPAEASGKLDYYKNSGNIFPLYNYTLLTTQILTQLSPSLVKQIDRVK